MQNSGRVADKEARQTQSLDRVLFLRAGSGAFAHLTPIPSASLGQALRRTRNALGMTVAKYLPKSIRPRDLLLGKFTQYGELERFALESFDDEYQPDDDGRQGENHSQQYDQKMPKNGNNEQEQADQLECNSDHDERRPQKQTLLGMKAQKTISLVWLEQQKDDSWDECDIGQSPGNIFRKDAYLAMNALRLHGPSAAWAKRRVFGHRGGAMGTGDRHRLLPRTLAECEALWQTTPTCTGTAQKRREPLGSST